MSAQLAPSADDIADAVRAALLQQGFQDEGGNSVLELDERIADVGYAVVEVWPIVHAVLRTLQVRS